MRHRPSTEEALKKTNLTVLILILVVATLLLSMAMTAFAHEPTTPPAAPSPTTDLQSNATHS
jgi:hypothetical protein